MAAFLGIVSLLLTRSLYQHADVALFGQAPGLVLSRGALPNTLLPPDHSQVLQAPWDWINAQFGTQVFAQGGQKVVE